MVGGGVGGEEIFLCRSLFRYDRSGVEGGAMRSRWLYDMYAPLGTKGNEAERFNASGSRPKEQVVHDVAGATADS